MKTVWDDVTRRDRSNRSNYWGLLLLLLLRSRLVRSSQRSSPLHARITAAHTYLSVLLWNHHYSFKFWHHMLICTFYWSPDDGQCFARNMYRLNISEIYTYWLHQAGVSHSNRCMMHGKKGIKSTLLLSFNLQQSLPKGLLPSGFSPKPHVCCMSWPSHPPWFYHPNKIQCEAQLEQLVGCGNFE